MAFPSNHRCRHEGCPQFTRGFQGYCQFSCGQVYCPTHRMPPYHMCRVLMQDWETNRLALTEINDSLLVREWLRLQLSLDRDDLILQAKALRPGHECDIDMPSASEVRGWTTDEHRSKWMEWRSHLVGRGWGEGHEHYLLTFDDGVKWVVRCRRLREDGPDPGLLRVVMDSECETMRVLHNSGLAVPQVFKPAIVSASAEDSSTRNTLYFFMEFVGGRPFPVLSFPRGPSLVEQLRKEGELTHVIEDTFIRSVTKQMIKLSEIKFTSMGSLYPGPDGGEPIVGPAVQSTVGFSDHPYFYGPFKRAKERWLPVVDQELDYILNHEQQQGFGVELSYLAYLELRDAIECSEELNREESEFYLMQLDSHGRQYMWDGKGEISSWLDWECTITTTKAEAFAAPYVFGGGDFELCLTSWEERLIKVYAELGRPDLAECVAGERKYHWLKMFLYADRGEMPKWEHLLELRHVLVGDAPPVLITGDVTTMWLAHMRSKFGEDPGHKIVTAREMCLA